MCLGLVSRVVGRAGCVGRWEVSGLSGVEGWLSRQVCQSSGGEDWLSRVVGGEWVVWWGGLVEPGGGR